MKTTDSSIYFTGEITPADAYGNNVAWVCPCKHPVLFICLENQKGFDGKFTVCKGCGKLYSIRPENDNNLVIVAAE